MALQWALVSGTACSVPSTLPVAGYRIYRSTVSGLLYGSVGSIVSPLVSTFTDGSVANGTTYYYAISTFDTGSPPNESTDIFAPFETQ